jgi:hypothetical protein
MTQEIADYHEMKCPSCGRADSLDIAATIFTRLVEDGADVDLSRDGSHHWEAGNAINCGCGWVGRVWKALEAYKTDPVVKPVKKTVPTYRTVTVEELYPTVTSGGEYELFVYSTTNNPDGATRGTFAKSIGGVEGYTQAADLWAAAQATALVLGGSPVGLAVLCEDSQ